MTILELINTVYAKWGEAISQTSVKDNYSMENSTVVAQIPAATLYFTGLPTGISTLSEGEGGVTPTIQVDIYGPGFEDGLRREFTSELIGTFGGGKVQYIDDPSLPAGTEQTIIKEHTGKKYQTYKHYYDAEGNLVKTEKFSIETYDNKPAKIRRGTGAPTPTPAPTPETPATPTPTPDVPAPEVPPAAEGEAA